MHVRIVKGIQHIVCFLFFVVLIWLTTVAGVSTAHITSDNFERTYLVADNIWINLLLSLAFLIFCMLYQRLKLRIFFCELFAMDEKYCEETIRKCLLLLIGIIGSIFVISSMRAPKSDTDPYIIVNTANAWKRGDFSSITTPGGYLDRYPNQWGIVVILYGLSFLFGDHNYIALQILNVVGLVWFYHSMAELSDRISADGSKKAGNSVLTLGILFIPLILFTTFVYGTMMGLAFSAAALVKLDDIRRKFCVRQIFQSCLLLLTAVIIKQNYLIFALGFLLALIFLMIRESNWKLSIPCLGLAAVLLLNTSIVSFLVTSITGKTAREDSGLSSLAWVDMGLQENHSEYRYDGWWARYYTYSSYNDNAYSKQAQRAVALEEIKERLKEFQQDWGYAFHFFAGKNASQWNNPDFQSFLINKTMQQSGSPFSSPTWINRLFNIKQSEKLSALLNRLQFIILMGAVFSMLFQRDKGFIPFSICIVFLGGFVFHTVWEAKGQYVLPYFMMLFPLSAEGWKEAVYCFRRDAVQIRETKKLSKPIIIEGAAVVFIIGILAVIQAGVIPFFNDTIRLDRDNEAYESYLAENLEYNTVLMKEGVYCISCAEDSSYLSVQQSEEAGAEIHLTDEQDESSVFNLKHFSYNDDDYRLHFTYADKCLDVSGGTANVGDKVWTYNSNSSTAQRWKIIKSDTNGVYYIYYRNNLYLTWEPESKTMTVSPKNGSVNQLWYLKPVKE